MFKYRIATFANDHDDTIEWVPVKGYRLSTHLAARRKGKGFWKIDHLPTGYTPGYTLIPATLAMLRERAEALERAVNLNRQAHEFNQPTDGSPWVLRELFVRLGLKSDDPNAPQWAR